MNRRSTEARHSLSDSQLVRTRRAGTAGGGTPSLGGIVQTAPVDGVAIAYDERDRICLNPTGATEGQTWVWNAIDETYELRTVPTGSGTAKHMAVWDTSGTLRAGPIITETGACALGVGVTGEPTDSFFYINVGETTDFSGLHIEHAGTNPGDTDLPALIIDSGSRVGGARITQTAVSYPVASVTGPAPALSLVNTAAKAGGLDVSLTSATGGGYGVRVVTASGASAVGLSIADGGTGGAILAEGKTTLRVPTGSTTTQTLLVQARSTTTVSAAEMQVGKGAGVTMSRVSGIIGSPTAGMIVITDGGNSGTGGTIDVTNTTGASAGVKVTSMLGAGKGFHATHAGTGEAGYFEITNDASGADAVHAVTAGSGDAVAAINSGTGYAVHAEITNADSTADVIRATHSGAGAVYRGSTTGNSRLLYLSRNVSGATARGAEILLDHAADAGIALYVQHDGAGIGEYIVCNGNSVGLTVASNDPSATQTAATISNAGSGRGLTITQAGSGGGLFVNKISDSSSTQSAITAIDASLAACIYAEATASNDGLEVIAATGKAIDAASNSSTNATVAIVQSGSADGLTVQSTSGRGVSVQSSKEAAEFVSNGTGTETGVLVAKNNGSATGAALVVDQQGVSYAIRAARSNASATVPMVRIEDTANSGQDVAYFRHAGTTGGAIHAEISSTSNASPAVYAETNGASSVAVHAYQAGTSGSALKAENGNASSTSNTAHFIHNSDRSVLLLQHAGGGTPTTSLYNLIIGVVGGTQLFRVDNTGKAFHNGGSQNSGADFAEMRLLEDGTEAAPGDVLEWSTAQPGRVRRATEGATRRVAGVFSTRAGYESVDVDDAALAGNLDAAVPLAVCGIVPCRVVGPVAIGDLLVATADGRAVVADDPRAGTVVAKAIEACDGDGVIRVQMLLS